MKYVLTVCVILVSACASQQPQVYNIGVNAQANAPGSVGAIGTSDSPVVGIVGGSTQDNRQDATVSPNVSVPVSGTQTR